MSVLQLIQSGNVYQCQQALDTFKLGMLKDPSSYEAALTNLNGYSVLFALTKNVNQPHNVCHPYMIRLDRASALVDTNLKFKVGKKSTKYSFFYGNIHLVNVSTIIS